MNRALLVILLSAACPTMALAQNGTFNGFYAGGSVGAALGRADHGTSTIDTGRGYDLLAGTYFQTSSVPLVSGAGRQRAESSVASGGGQAGYNWRRGRLLFGVEGDLGSMPFNETRSQSRAYDCCPGSFTITHAVKTAWVVTGRPRIGVVSGPWLVAGTAGVALTHVEYEGTFNDTTASPLLFDFPSAESASRDGIRAGWTAGGGVERALGARRWSLSGSYLYADFGMLTARSTNLTQAYPQFTAAFPNAPFTHTSRLRTHVVRFGVNFGF